MFRVTRSTQRISQRLPDARITGVFFSQLREIGENFLDPFAAAKHVVIGMKCLRQVTPRGSIPCRA